MKKYYPLLSVAMAVVALLLPLGLLSLAGSSERGEVAPAGPAPDQSPADVTQELGRLDDRLQALEAEVRQLRQAQSPQLATSDLSAEKARETQLATSDLSAEKARETQLATSDLSAEAQALLPARADPMTRDETTPNPTETEASPDATAVARTAGAPRASLGSAVTNWLARFAAEIPTGSTTVSTNSAQAENDAPQATTLAVQKTPARETDGKAEGSVRDARAPEPKDTSGKEKRTTRAMKTTAADPVLEAEAGEIEAMGGVDQLVEARLVNVNVTRPRPGYVVGRWENLIAVTPEAGWPVVLVRSDVKGDSWWVQQVVSRQGNVIAARVNFGNVDTVSGHGFELVVLLLDSSAEAVRFRTAREFKSIPPAVKRSKIFRYVHR